jgi:hypothetical protein
LQSSSIGSPDKTVTKPSLTLIQERYQAAETKSHDESTASMEAAAAVQCSTGMHIASEPKRITDDSEVVAIERSPVLLPPPLARTAGPSQLATPVSLAVANDEVLYLVRSDQEPPSVSPPQLCVTHSLGSGTAPVDHDPLLDSDDENVLSGDF